MISNETHNDRTIRSFVQRGRVTDSQKQAWNDYGAEYIVAPEHVVWDNAHVEIGFGNGSALIHTATQWPDREFIGIEVHKAGIGRILHLINSAQLPNVKILYGDAVQILQQHVPNASLGGMNIFFSDPWPKQRHHKRRLIQPDFVDLLAQKLSVAAYLHLATDWQPYAQQMLTVMQHNQNFVNKYSANNYLHKKQVELLRPSTKFEQRGVRLGHDSWDLLFIKLGN
ncbi:MAG: tRNA (guanosine(46)-N7)-methyltransferase TrmB [Thiotrichales bacterium]|nr:MAG: tRNA (guanosine(46)-N7)-methyltransferase TrmB [Thiotrichales bacterium]